ncbi:C4-dicarboxylate-specific signal transduction histidine kinase [Variovorax guangxiensis]|nr:C4-dicarboxylate-specific signal transduction histidine kinase [Variovorax guangxiensis]
MLVGMVERVERVEHDGTDPAAVARLRKVLATRVDELPQLDGLHIYDEDGNWVANSRKTQPESLNNANREYFLFHRAHEDRGPHIGIPVKSRTTGKLLVPVSRRINHADGSFAGVALATINIDFFMKFYDSLDIGQAGAVGLVLETGTMMTRWPYTPEMVLLRPCVRTPRWHRHCWCGPCGRHRYGTRSQEARRRHRGAK